MTHTDHPVIGDAGHEQERRSDSGTLASGEQALTVMTMTHMTATLPMTGP